MNSLKFNSYFPADQLALARIPYCADSYLNDGPYHLDGNYSALRPTLAAERIETVFLSVCDKRP